VIVDDALSDAFSARLGSALTFCARLWLAYRPRLGATCLSGEPWALSSGYSGADACPEVPTAFSSWVGLRQNNRPGTVRVLPANLHQRGRAIAALAQSSKQLR
jgi:hypothetical protein